MISIISITDLYVIAYLHVLLVFVSFLKGNLNNWYLKERINFLLWMLLNF